MNPVPGCPKTALVVRNIPVFNKWYLCHAISYQNAFRSSVNGFSERQQAVKFAEERGYVVEYHDGDQLQQYGVEQ